jgi:tetratricopeptide (TPR) repeat protein
VPYALRWFALLSIIAAHAVGAAERVYPADRDFIVVRQEKSEVRASLREREAAATTTPNDPAVLAVLIREYLASGRSARDPRYIGRAEAALQRWRAPLTLDLAVLKAEILQHQHDFRGAIETLDVVLRQAPRIQEARALRGSIALVVGDYALASRDCALVMSSARNPSEQLVGAACLAAAIGARGEFERADGLVARVLASAPADTAPPVRGYAWAVRGEIADRRGDAPGAIAHYTRAIALNPIDDPSRVTLAGLLAARGRVPQALAATQVDRPGLGLLVTQALHSRGAAQRTLASQVRGLLDLEQQRGDERHWREAAIAAAELDSDADRALNLARENFARQRELVDVRLYARLATQTGSQRDQDALQAWLATSGVRDAALESWLPGSMP